MERAKSLYRARVFAVSGRVKNELVRLYQKAKLKQSQNRRVNGMGRSVQPLRNMALINRICEDLSKYQDEHGKRIYLLWMTGIYTGLRVSDLVRLRKVNVKGDSIVIRETKTGKQTVIPIAEQLKMVYASELDELNDDDYLFLSRQRDSDGTARHISTGTAYNDLKWLQSRYPVPDAFGCHSMRKTFGYWHYQNNGDLELLREHFNHADVSITRRYIGLEEEEQKRAINNLGFGFKPNGRKKKPTRQENGASAPLEKTGRKTDKQKWAGLPTKKKSR